MNIAKFLRTPFLTEYFRWLLLNLVQRYWLRLVVISLLLKKISNFKVYKKLMRYIEGKLGT